MGFDLKYGHIQTQFGHIPDDEPMFLIRGQDVNAAGTIKDYKQKVVDMGGNPDVVAEIEKSIKLIESWRKKKLAD